AVHDQLKRTVKKLYDYESKLELRNKDKLRYKILEKMKNEKDLNKVLDLVKELEKVE
ncbi:MAG: DNA-binding protein, partial [Candidatus Izimaplasma sp.]|nr:DNA-binding protein [Candidatus Izimaplasma bacterium]